MRRCDPTSRLSTSTQHELFGEPPTPRVTGGMLLLAVIAALLLRSYRLGDQILGGDELHVLNVLASTPLTSIPSTVGEYDYSIPLALLYGALSRFVLLDEWVLRAPMLLLGALLPLAAYFAFRPLLAGWVALGVAWICAVHPFTVFYGRFVRPYGIVLVLLLAMFGLLVRAFMASTPHPWRKVVLAVLCGAFAIWTNVPALFACAGIGLAALFVSLCDRTRKVRIAYAFAFGIGVLGLALALYAPALPSLVAQLGSNKAGQGLITIEAIVRTARVLAGTPVLGVAIVVVTLGIVGALYLAKQRSPAVWWLTIPIFVIAVAVFGTRPQLLEFDLVLARYLFSALPFVAALALLGGARIVATRVTGRRAIGALCVLLAGFSWSAAGSLRSLYGVERGFAHHGRYQTYDFVRDGATPLRVSSVYDVLRDSPRILEWPPPTGFDQNYLHLAQEVHRRPIGLLIVEERPFSASFLALRNCVRLADVEARRLPAGTGIVLHRNPQFEALSLLHDREPRQVTTRNPQGFARLVERLKRSLGEPRAQDAFDVAFVVP